MDATTVTLTFVVNRTFGVAMSCFLNSLEFQKFRDASMRNIWQRWNRVRWFLIRDFSFFTLFLFSLIAFSDRFCALWQFVILSNHGRNGYLFVVVVTSVTSDKLSDWSYFIRNFIRWHDPYKVKYVSLKYCQKYSNEARTSDLDEKSISILSHYINIDQFVKYIDNIIIRLYIYIYIYIFRALKVLVESSRLIKVQSNIRISIYVRFQKDRCHNMHT